MWICLFLGGQTHTIWTCWKNLSASLQNAPRVVCQRQSGAQDVRLNGIARGKMIERLSQAKRVWQTDDSRKLRFHFPSADYGFLAGLLSNMTVLWFLFTTLLVGQENPRFSQPIRVKNLPPTFFQRLWPVTCMNFEFWFAPCDVNLCSDWPWWWFSFCLIAIFLSIIADINLTPHMHEFADVVRRL